MLIKLTILGLLAAGLLTGTIGTRAERPNPRLTPGAALPVTAADVCAPGYARRVRDVPLSVKRQAFAEYGVVPRPGERFEIDHLVPLELGGANSLANLWPQPFAGQWTAGDKDRLENCLHRQVCAGREPLAQAQQDIASDWVGTYGRTLAGGRTDGH